MSHYTYIHALRFIKIIRAFQWCEHEPYETTLVSSEKFFYTISERSVNHTPWRFSRISHTRSHTPALFPLPSANNEKRDDHVVLRRISPRLVARGTELVEIIPVSIPWSLSGGFQPRTKRQRRGNQGCDGATERTKKKKLFCCARYPRR